jgi:hypothetical protein
MVFGIFSMAIYSIGHSINGNLILSVDLDSIQASQLSVFRRTKLGPMESLDAIELEVMICIIQNGNGIGTTKTKGIDL